MSSATKVGYCPQLGIFDYIGNFRQPQINLFIFLLLFCWKIVFVQAHNCATVDLCYSGW